MQNQDPDGDKKVARILDNCIEQALILEFAYTGCLEVRAGPATRISVREVLPRDLGPLPTKVELCPLCSSQHNLLLSSTMGIGSKVRGNGREEEKQSKRKKSSKNVK